MNRSLEISIKCFAPFQVPENVLAPKGKERDGSLSSWERGKNTTVSCAMSSAGQFIPPMFIFTRGKTSKQLGKEAPHKSVIEGTKNVWTNEQMYVRWLKHSAMEVRPS